MSDVVAYAIAGAIVGLLGALVGALLTRTFRLTGIARTVVMVALVVGPVAVSRTVVDRFYLTPRFVAEMKTSLEAYPIFKTILEYYPASEKTIETALLNYRSGRIDNAELRNVFSTEVGKLRENNFSKASEDNTLAMLNLAYQEIRAVQKHSETECTSYVTNGTTTTPLAEMLGPDLAARDQAVVAAFLKQAATNPAQWTAPTPDNDLQKVAMAAVEKLPPERAAAFREWAAAGADVGKLDVDCTFMVALLEELMLQPPHEAAAIYQDLSAAESPPPAE